MPRPTSLLSQVLLALLAAALLGGGLATAGGGEAERPAAPPNWTEDAGGPAATASRDEDPDELRPAAVSRPVPSREEFSHTCGMCHALRAAGASGMFGPDLDASRPSAARVKRMIRTGSLDGVMQPGLLTGDDARRMARYVERVAGRDGGQDVRP